MHEIEVNTEPCVHCAIVTTLFQNEYTALKSNFEITVSNEVKKKRKKTTQNR